MVLLTTEQHQNQQNFPLFEDDANRQFTLFREAYPGTCVNILLKMKTSSQMPLLKVSIHVELTESRF